MSRNASAPWLRLTMTFLVVVGLLLDHTTDVGDEAGGDDSILEFATASESSDGQVLSVHGDTVRVVRPERALGRAVDPRSPRLRARPGGGDPFRRFREAAADEPAPARLFGGLVGVIELRV